MFFYSVLSFIYGASSYGDIPRQHATEDDSSGHKRLVNSLAIFLLNPFLSRKRILKSHNSHQTWRIMSNHPGAEVREGKVIEVSLPRVDYFSISQAPED